MKGGKSCGHDHVVAEMLCQLDIDVCDLSAPICTRRLLNPPAERYDGLWDLYEAQLFKKKGDAKKIKDRRAIGLLTCT